MPIAEHRDIAWVIVPAILAAGITLVTLPLVRRIATACELYDLPDAGLKPHEKPIPYLGGVALFSGWLGAIVSALALDHAMPFEWFWIATGGTILLLLGLTDDIRRLPPLLRLVVQAAVAGLLLYAGLGVGVASSLFGGLRGILPSSLWSGPVEITCAGLFCAAVLAGATNATNLIDGLDGLCAGVIAIAAIGFIIVLTLLSESFTTHPSAAVIIIVLAAALFGACLAFLVANYHPASMFMGDSGSMLLGYTVALILILLAEYASWRGLLAGVFVFAFPIFDTALAVARRWRNHKPLFVGDRSHFYDQIHDRGFSVRQTVLICYVLCLIFDGLAAAITQMSGTLVILALSLFLFSGILICWRFGLLKVDDAAERSEEAKN